MAQSDVELVAASLSGSQLACRELVERFQRPVYNLIVRMIRDPALAEDLSQDTFVKAFTHLSTFDAKYRFASWILKIAHNTAIDYLRRHTRAPASLDDGDDGEARTTMDRSSPDPAALLARKELAQALDEAIDRLKPDYRKVVVLRYQEELEYEEIAQVLSMPIGTVKSYLHRARRELAEMVRRAGWEPNGVVERKAAGGRR